MKKVLLFFFIYSFCFGQEFIVYEQLDSIIVNYIKDYREVLEKNKIEPKLKKGPYESTFEFNKRYSKKKNELIAIRQKKLDDVFKKFDNTYKVNIILDSVTYDADKEIAELHFPRIKIPNKLGNPFYNCYVYPVFSFPEEWYAKKGFGFILKKIPIPRERAKKNNIIKRKGEIKLEFQFSSPNNLPEIRLKSFKWVVNDKNLWIWRGKASIPRSKLRGVLRSTFSDSLLEN